MPERETLESYFSRFQATYSAARVIPNDFQLAFAVLEEAVNAYPDDAFRYFAAMGSAQLGQTLVRSWKAPYAVEWLDGLLAQHPTINMLCLQQDLEAMLALRERNIDKGLGSPILAAQGKTASTSVANIFNSGFSLPSVMYSLVTEYAIPSWTRDYVRGGASYTTHLSPHPVTVERFKAAGITKMIVHTRDPRQALVSLAHHLDRYPEQLVVIMNKVDLTGADRDIGARAQTLIDEYTKAVRWIEGWVALSSEIEIMFSTFEEFVTDWDGFVDRYLDFYGAPRKYFDREAARNQHAGTDYHFRSGKTDEWRETLPAELGKLLTERLPEPLMERFGWQP